MTLLCIHSIRQLQKMHADELVKYDFFPVMNTDFKVF
jgi:hypothetical protein